MLLVPHVYNKIYSRNSFCVSFLFLFFCLKKKCEEKERNIKTERVVKEHYKHRIHACIHRIEWVESKNLFMFDEFAEVNL